MNKWATVWEKKPGYNLLISSESPEMLFLIPFIQITNFKIWTIEQASIDVCNTFEKLLQATELAVVM